MKTRKFELIECPNCKYEYLPAEIFVPKYYFGHPTDIVRDEKGKIVSYEGTSVDLFETYKCDCCNFEFRVVSKLQLTTELTFPGSFDGDYITKITTDLFKVNDQDS